MSNDWKLFVGNFPPHDWEVPDAPPWRKFGGQVAKERHLPNNDEQVSFAFTERGKSFCFSEDTENQVIASVNAALYLRRPLLITGPPGSGKSSLIYAVAWELRLGEVLRWSITSRSTLQQGLYHYDAIGRLQDSQVMSQLDDHRELPDISKYLKLGPLGTALLPTNRPRALLIDEIDKSDLDLPSDLLNIFEEGEFRIPELERLEQEVVEIREESGAEKFPLTRGHVRCCQFPFIVMTSNDEREFPAPFLRRCIQLTMGEPDATLLSRIVRAHLGTELSYQAEALIDKFMSRRNITALATDQLLNALFMIKGSAGKRGMSEREQRMLIESLFHSLNSTDSQ
jgi:MoxR-like ATPase